MALLVAFFVVLAILPQARQWDQEPTGEAAESQPVSAVQTELADTKQEAARFTVCLDPGHGGNDSGCVSGKRHESDDALMMAKLVKKYLEQENVQVVLTRTKDKYVERAGTVCQSGKCGLLCLHPPQPKPAGLRRGDLDTGGLQQGVQRSG